MKNIISASRRTDIPAFYSKWFENRVREGYCCYPNPLYPQKNHVVSLCAEDVAGFVFWTRWAAPITKVLPVLDAMGHQYYFQYTINGYPRHIDKCCPRVEYAIDDFIALVGKIGKGRAIWRYDPIILSP